MTSNSETVRKPYEALEAEIVRFEAEDVITASTPTQTPVVPLQTSYQIF